MKSCWNENVEFFQSQVSDMSCHCQIQINNWKEQLKRAHKAVLVLFAMCKQIIKFYNKIMMMSRLLTLTDFQVEFLNLPLYSQRSYALVPARIQEANRIQCEPHRWIICHNLIPVWLLSHLYLIYNDHILDCS
jgi:hypothetical protein